MIWKARADQLLHNNIRPRTWCVISNVVQKKVRVKLVVIFTVNVWAIFWEFLSNNYNNILYLQSKFDHNLDTSLDSLKIYVNLVDMYKIRLWARVLNIYLKSFTVPDLVLFSMKCAKKFRYPADNITNKNKKVIDVYFCSTCVRYLCFNFFYL